MDDRKLTDVRGIGPKTADGLAALGIDSIRALTAAPNEFIATLPGFHVNRAQQLKDAAAELLGETASPADIAEAPDPKPKKKTKAKAKKKPSVKKKSSKKTADKKKTGKKPAKKKAKKKAKKSERKPPKKKAGKRKTDKKAKKKKTKK